MKLRLFPCLLAMTLIGLKVPAAAQTEISSAANASLDKGTVVAAPPEYRSRSWQVEDGLPHNVIRAVLQTRDGYLWVGTQQGPARFNGWKFQTFERDFPALNNPAVNALLESRDGSLWIATAGGQLICFKDARFAPFELGPTLTNSPLLSLHESKDGTLWIGAGDRVVRIKDGQLMPTNDMPLLQEITARSFFEDTKSNLWIGSSKGVLCWSNGVVTQNSSQSNDFVRVVYGDRQGSLWVGRAGSQWIGATAELRQLKDGKLSRFSTSNGLPDNDATALHEDRFGNLWIGTSNGLCRRTNGKFVTELDHEGNAYDAIWSFCEDREGNLWIGAKDGLHCLTRQPFSSLTTRQGLTQNNVTCVYEDKEGVLWFGTWGGGLHRMRDGKITVCSAPTGLPSGQEKVLSISDTRTRGMWFSTDFEGGAFQFESQNDRFTRYYMLAVRAIHEDREERLWVGTRNALHLFKDEKLIPHTRKDGLAGDGIRVLFEDHNGTLLIGTQSGLSCWREEKFSLFSPASELAECPIAALYEDAEHTLWIGTIGRGLLRWKDGKVFSYTSTEGLLTDDVLEILEDNFGHLWMCSVKGVFRVAKKELNALAEGLARPLDCISYGRADGMLSSVCAGVGKPGAWKSRDGRLWFATTKGLAVIDPNTSIGKNELPPPVVIEAVMADKKKVGDSANQRASEVSATHSLANSLIHKLVIPPGRGELEFHYTALSFTAPEKNQFKYKLEGFDREWIEARTRRVAYYNNLSPGSYTFRVIACNNDGIWNSVGSSVQLRLQPHFWQTWWFVGVCGIAAIGLVGGTTRYATRKKMQRQLELLEREHAVERERTRIAQDMHDTLGASLTEIQVLTTVTRNAKNDPAQVESQSHRIANVAQKVNDSLHGIVWAINPKNDSLERLASYLYEHAESFLETSSVRCRLDVPNVLPKIPVSSEVRHNIFLVVKEALNNVVKYAEASEVVFRLGFENSVLSISIEDNGKGFVVTETDTFGNGLHNMQKRMETIGGTFELSTQPGKGTRIQIVISLRPTH